MLAAAEIAATALTIISTWAYGRRGQLGPFLGVVSNVPWMIVAVQSHLMSLAVVSLVMTFIHCRNLRKELQ